MTSETNTVEQELAELRAVVSRLQRAADELEIRNAVATIFLMSDDEPDLAVYGANFTADAVWERIDGGSSGSHLGTRLEGLDRILADRQHLRDNRVTGPNSTIKHLITTVAVSFEEDGTATARSKFLVVNGAKPRPIIDAVGRYEDTFRRTDAGWKLAHRRYSSQSANH